MPRLLAILLGTTIAVGFATPAVADAPAVAPPRVGGYLQWREVGQDRIGLTSYLNRARLSLDGGLTAGFTYRLLVEFEASAGAKSPATPSLREAYARWTRGPLALEGGQFKTPFTREYLIPTPALETADLATVIDSLAPKYDVGLMGEYAPAPWGTVWLGVCNGEGQNATANRDSMVMVVARVAARPVPQLGVGASGTRDGADSLRWGLDADIGQWGALVRGEWMKRHVRGRAGGMDDSGWSVLAQYRATTLLQPLVRVEDYQRPTRGTAKRIRATTFGVNLDLVPTRVRLLLEEVSRWSGAHQLRANTLLAQLQLKW
jgi:hypothetical protein